MGRRSYYDTDEERLPEGMERIGYDADDETYTFRDRDGSIWESAPGSRYGGLHKIRDGRRNNDDDDSQAPFLPPPYTPGNGSASEPEPKQSWRHELMPLLNFFLLIGLFLVGTYWFLGRASSSTSSAPEVVCEGAQEPYSIRKGDTCWDLAQAHNIGLGALTAANPGIVCESLKLGQTICVPAS